MLTEYIRLLTTVTILLCLIVFGGCSLTKDLTWMEVDAGPEDSDLAVQQETDKDPELSFVEVESEICLDQELEALKLTGNWDAPQTEIIQQTMIDDSAGPDVLYDFPITVNRQVEVYLDIFTGKQRTYFKRWLARSGRYRPMMEAELKAAGLPLDLTYLAMIESGFNQRAYSRSRAVGLWQFMSGTGRDYGLAVTKYVDERRDAEKSTKAAVSYLSDLYGEFGDWYLAVAAYNGGPGTIRKAVKKTNTDDFWKIAQKKYLRLETKRYVPKLIAAIIIAKDPEKYGFPDIVYEKPFSYDTIAVGPGLSLEAAALLTNSNSKVLKSLNQELKTGKTPLDSQRYDLKIPNGTKKLAERNLPRLHSVVSTDYGTHVIKKGETLAQICRKYSVNTTTLLKVNNLKSNKLVAGARLRIPFRTIQYRILPKGTDVLLASKNDLILHTIKKGETISKISRQYQIPGELIVAWNGLSSVHKISEGQQLALYMSSDTLPESKAEVSRRGNISKTKTTASRTKKIPQSEKIVLLADSKKRAPSKTTAAEEYKWYLIKNGDSLWTISRRFNVSPNDIKKLNNLKNNLIHPGSRLKVKDA